MKKLLCTLLMLCLPLTCLAASQEDALNAAFDRPTQTAAVYTDLDTVPWAREAIHYLSTYRVIPPATDGLFHPNEAITREEFVNILILALGVYDPSATSQFEDSHPYDWHYGSISTAKKLGITTGISETEFGVGLSLTRQEMVTLICRAAQQVGIVLAQPNGTSFLDSADIAPYALSSVGSLVEEGIVSGTPEGYFLPLKETTRAEACKIIYMIATKNT